MGRLLFWELMASPSDEQVVVESEVFELYLPKKMMGLNFQMYQFYSDFFGLVDPNELDLRDPS